MENEKLNVPAAVPAPLIAAVSRVETAASDVRLIEDATSATRGQLEANDAEMSAARQHLADVEAAAAINGGELDKAARKNVLLLRDQREFLEARLDGLQTRLRASTTTLNEAQHDLAVEFRLWQRQEVEAVLADYREALAAFLRALHVVAGAGTALGTNRLGRVVRGTALCDPDEPEKNPANMRRHHWRERRPLPSFTSGCSPCASRLIGTWATSGTRRQRRRPRMPRDLLPEPFLRGPGEGLRIRRDQVPFLFLMQAPV